MIYKPSIATTSAGRHRSHPRYRQCLAHWTFSEGGGTESYDVTKMNPFPRTRVTLVGSTWSPGLFGPAMLFDGVNDFSYLENSLALNYSTVTYSVWVNPAGTGWRGILGNGTNDVGLFVSTTNFVQRHKTAPSITSTVAISNGVWTHIGLTWDGTTARLYLNGRLDTSTANTPVFDVALIGTDEASVLDETFEGMIDEIRLYNRVLNDAEIWSLYADPFLEFRQPPRRRSSVSVLAPTVRSLALLGVGR